MDGTALSESGRTELAGAAGVPVIATRYQGIIHDFVMLNALRDTQAAEAAITQATTTLRSALHTS
ncbi:hypothetical protein STBA_37560 [Streptomyces sp. MP131-18]|nr:hypothetical protein STBA_37560 [Streptomyces sp. MP131-18]